MSIKSKAIEMGHNLAGFWAWVGQNATHGTPNPRTGGMSMYGHFRFFDTKQERDDFINSYYDINKRAIKCTVETGRKFSLGSSVVEYIEELAMVKSGYAVDKLYN